MAFGIGAIVQVSTVAFTVIKFVGAAYLIYLGVQAIRHRHAISDSFTARPTPARAHQVIADGFIVGLANPKSVVFFAATLSQFVNPAAGAVTVQFLLGVVFVAIAVVFDSA